VQIGLEKSYIYCFNRVKRWIENNAVEV